MWAVSFLILNGRFYRSHVHDPERKYREDVQHTNYLIEHTNTIHVNISTFGCDTPVFERHPAFQLLWPVFFSIFCIQRAMYLFVSFCVFCLLKIIIPGLS